MVRRSADSIRFAVVPVAGGRIGIKYGEVMKSWQLWLNRFTLAIDSKASELDN
jgi:hypothetical protein